GHLLIAATPHFHAGQVEPQVSQGKQATLELLPRGVATVLAIHRGAPIALEESQPTNALLARRTLMRIRLGLQVLDLGVDAFERARHSRTLQIAQLLRKTCRTIRQLRRRLRKVRQALPVRCRQHIPAPGNVITVLKRSSNSFAQRSAQPDKRSGWRALRRSQRRSLRKHPRAL